MRLHALTLSCFLLPALANANGSGLVLTQMNAAGPNAVLAYERNGDGLLTFRGAFPTGGMGLGSGLGSQGAVAATENRRYILVVNAGSNDLSVFRKTSSGLVLGGVVPTGGMRPTSVAERDGLVCVLNAASATVTTFHIDSHGTVTPTMAPPAPLSAPNSAPAQVGIAPDGETVVVSERATNLLSLFPVLSGGTLGAIDSRPSAGATPFGFEFGRRGELIVSEAFGGMTDASAVSSYLLDGQDLDLVSASVPTTETAACWIAITRNGRYAYTTNTGSASITGYSVDKRTGALASLDADGKTGELVPGSNPLDAALSRDSRFLFALSPATGRIAVFRVQYDGTLDARPDAMGIPMTAFGLWAE